MIPPGSTIGILGGGQLGRMAALAARTMGYRIAIFDPQPACAAAAVADRVVTASWDDGEALAAFAAGCEVVTFEFENLSAPALRNSLAGANLRPGASVLEICQHRIREKSFLADNGFPTPPWCAVNAPEDLPAAIEKIGAPAVLKTARFGYDGKGQIRIPDPAAEIPEEARRITRDGPAILEAWVPFSGEYSVIVARRPSGEARTYPVCANHHHQHILATTHNPSGLPAALENEARNIGLGIAEAIDACGLLVIELFRTRDDRWLVNELAPRPHNSGHFSIEGSVTSQFANFIRAVCDLPLGETESIRPAAMVNLLGDLWAGGSEPPWEQLLALPGAAVHLYDKGEPRPGRKMGHITVTAPTSDELESVLADIRSILDLP